MIAPEFMDWFLARNAVQGQETSQSVRPDRRDNLFEPVTDLHRIRGGFNANAKATAAVFPGACTRVGIVAGGALFFFLLGVLVAA
jgi:hypothetical protein